MIPENFEYHSPSTIQEALEILSTHEDSKILAGGQSLLPLMKLRFTDIDHLVDISRIEELRGIRQENGTIVIGAMTTETDLIRSDLLWSKCPIIPEAAKYIADPQVRNLGTIGGNIAHGDPANDHPAVMIAAKADFILVGQSGSERSVPASEFFHGIYWTELEESELLKEIHIPVFASNSSFGYSKLKRKTGDYATAGASVILGIEGDVCTDAAITLTNAGPASMRVQVAEKVLIDNTLTDEVIEQAAAAVMDVCDPVEDLRGSPEYKRKMAAEMTKRSIRAAVARAGD